MPDFGGKHAGKRMFIPRILLSPPSSAELPFEFRRARSPLRPAFAMRINKSQGQTLTHLGLVLNDPVFTDGHVYVTQSHVTIDTNLHLIVLNEVRVEGKLKNVVYQEMYI
jgi:ATP-dependent DNA helicase PIF1